jgi:hypothetical protein
MWSLGDVAEVFGKSLLPGGVWKPMSAVAAGEKEQLRSTLYARKMARRAGMKVESAWAKDPFAERFKTHPDFQPSSRKLSPLPRPFMRGVRQSLGAKQAAKVYREGTTYPAGFWAPDAAVAPTRGGLRMGLSEPFAGGKPAMRHLGRHESAHYATRRQVRRGRSRSPFKLAQIADRGGARLAREEGRADGEALRLGRRVGDEFPKRRSAYASRGAWGSDEEFSEYKRVRDAAMGGR